MITHEVPGGQSPDAGTGFQVRTLTPADLPAVLGLQARVRGALPDPSFLADDPPEFFEAHLGSWGVTGGVEADGALIAFGVLGLGQRVPVAENFGRLIGLPPDRLATVGQPDGVAVAAPWRGRGLQKLLLRWRLEQAAGAGCRDILSTCEPRNRVSLRNMMSFGMRAVRFDYLFGGLPRLVLHLDRGQKIPLDLTASQVVPVVPAALMDAFAAGLIGYDLTENGLSMAPAINNG